MKQEDKELLLTDLCARLPYKTYVKTTKGIGYVYAINTSQLIELSVANNSEYWSEVFNIDEIKPYLRPMSSMSEEEKAFYEYHKEGHCSSGWATTLVDWLNAHHFDFRNLIERGLAIAVTEKNNPYNK